MKKVIFVTNHKGFVKFNAPYMEWFKSHGWQVDDAAPGMEKEYASCYNNHYDVNIVRNPFSLGNLKAIREMRKILKQNKYDIIHCHTPMGAFVARMASIGLKDVKVIYTVHGYHFFKGAPLINWLVYFPIETLLKWKTDYLVTINNEDLAFARKWKMATRGIFKINGVGFRNKFSSVGEEVKNKIRAGFGLSSSDFVMLYTAQFIFRKNHRFILDAMPAIVKQIPNAKLVLVGNGDLWEEMKQHALDLGTAHSVKFMGGRSDVEKFCQMADIYVSSSFQEGLCISNLEAMACGLPLVISDIRGQNDVCIDNQNGFLFKTGDSDKFIQSVINLYQDKNLRVKMGRHNIADVNKFSLENSINTMSEIYKIVMNSSNH